MGIVTSRSHIDNCSFNSPFPSGPNTTATLPSIPESLSGSSSGRRKCLFTVLSPSSLFPEVPTTNEQSATPSSKVSTTLAPSRTSCAFFALLLASSDQSPSLPTTLRSFIPKFSIERATAPMLPSCSGLTRMTQTFWEKVGRF